MAVEGGEGPGGTATVGQEQATERNSTVDP